MAYEPTEWVSGETPLSAQNMNNIEQGIAALDESVSNLDTSGKWIQKGSKQTGKTSVTMPDLTKTTDIMIVANINAANAADTDDNAVMLQVHFPVLSTGLPLVQNRLRAGYYQDGTYGGLVQFVINKTAGTISLERATLNTEEENTTATTTWTVYYKYNNNL